MSAIRVLIVDDHPLLGEGLRVALEEDPALDVVGIATDAAETDELVSRHHPDVVLMDYALDATDGIALANDLRQRHPTTKFIILTGQRDDAVVLEAVERELDGFVRKTDSLDAVIGAIKSAHEGHPAFSPRDLAVVMREARAPHGPPTTLTARELEVLQLMATGTSTANIASTLYVSTNTVRSHVRHILEKLDAHSKLEAVAIAHRDGLIPRG